MILLALGIMCANGQSNSPALAAANNSFACDLYGQLRAEAGNIFYSPYSIWACLAMVESGARGDTASEMQQVLHFTPVLADIHSQYRSWQQQLTSNAPGDVQLSVANALWSQEGHPFLAEFLETARQDFGANLHQADFRTSAEPARQQINQWVSDRTAGRITDLIQPGLLDGNTRLVLVNAIYFKGKWQVPFKKQSTIDGSFSVTQDKSTTVPFMRATERFAYAETDDVQLLEMPYAGRRLSMVVVLPKTADKLAAIETSLNAANLNEWTSKLSAPGAAMRVDVWLPRFKMTSEFKLTETLARLGMSDAFTPKADFSGMDGAQDLFLSAVIHKAFVDVNEEGTEAAAATGTTVRALAVAPIPVKVFRADHPFLFLIRDVQTGCVLFAGRVTNPAS